MDGPERQPDREVLRQRLQFVRDALGRLEEIRAHGEGDFLSSHLLQDAAVRNLQVGIEALPQRFASKICRTRGTSSGTSTCRAFQRMSRSSAK